MALLIAYADLIGCATQSKLETVYCYRTLADVGCYAEPDSGTTRRLVGTYLRDPGAPSQVDGVAGGSPEPGAGFSGWFTRRAGIAGRVMSPVGTIVGLFR